MGHIARFCTDATKPQRYSEQSNFQKYADNKNFYGHRKVDICDYCSRRGHEIRNCIKLQKIKDMATKKPICSYCKQENNSFQDCPIIKEFESKVKICQKCKSTSHEVEYCPYGLSGNEHPPRISSV